MDEVLALREILLRNLEHGRQLADNLEARFLRTFGPSSIEDGTMSVYTYTSEVLMVALMDALAENDEKSRVKCLEEVSRALESALELPSENVRDAIDLRVVDRLLGSPRDWLELRPYVGSKFRARMLDRVRYFNWNEDVFGPLI
ncbi:hypothetical protein [Cellulosimicrobium cellulans]|uniref:hypothetical protein n=1 Tax=Cellulosimicrobium cellulans TaxID=1710 RepID=UPI001BA552FC|nr:hypothetical protein [Cellulosimicrobium cellulans]QUB98689.1 hypothetical protein J5A69_13070 [Cellulosimicrobium cellulans]